VNPGDWRLREGSYGPVAPAVLGREVAGTVAALGPGVSGFAVGDEVFGGCPDMQGGFAPLARVTAGFAALRPSAVSPSNAAVLPVAYGAGVLERVRAAAPDGVDGVFDLVGGDALRAVAGLVDPKRLRSGADKPLVRELGGDEVPRERSTAVLTALVRLVATGELDPHVSEVHPFEEAPAAMRAVESGHALGKVTIRL
jgi:NADPH2:quinone reductase